MKELKPCPFCGGDKLDISNKTTTINWVRKRHVAVYCKNCNAYGSRIIAKETESPEFCSEKYKLLAMERWNKRI